MHTYIHTYTHVCTYMNSHLHKYMHKYTYMYTHYVFKYKANVTLPLWQEAWCLAGRIRSFESSIVLGGLHKFKCSSNFPAGNVDVLIIVQNLQIHMLWKMKLHIHLETGFSKVAGNFAITHEERTSAQSYCRLIFFILLKIFSYIGTFQILSLKR